MMFLLLFFLYLFHVDVCEGIDKSKQHRYDDEEYVGATSYYLFEHKLLFFTLQR